MKKRLWILSGVFGVAMVAASLNLGNHMASAVVPGSNTMVSVTPAGSSSVGSGVASDGSKISRNGKFVGFMSTSNDVIASDGNYKADVFVRNLGANSTERVSMSTSGTESDADSRFGAISETGRYIVFTSAASNLIDGTTVTTPNYKEQLYMRDTETDTTTLISKNSSGVIADSGITAHSVSSDGRFVLFESRATNLGPSVTNGPYSDNLYMLDRVNNSFTILNYAEDNSLSTTNGVYPEADMSCDGSLVVFQSAQDLTSSYSPHQDIYLLDRRAGNELTNLTSVANDAAMSPSISCNGNYISFASFATDLDPASSPSSYIRHAFVYDRINDTFTMADKTTSGTEGNANAACTASLTCISVSDNGIAAFASEASNLVSGGTSGKQVYVHKLDGAVTELLSRSSGGTQANNNSVDPVIDSRGEIVAYSSNATNLVSVSDSNNWTDVFTSLTGY